ncbi:MAG: carboxymuconolactone decarboxylase family protein [Marinobacter sp.]|uniref:carboxymuconolactone decarboxylase family protein n=1 Tax=Marinobacter sp. TaxID=50741 RepID=UPI001B47758F|nr:carboxymuconolactone decarboxylase family protein [Marinobacter sp.]MBQ0748281.1 carboxymuconolactone decarboxylase family protein [Marinobacter sp.]MBQ0816341.1 carboxymuconolactone decarboxylase family protein [Marinobacter sp.]|tara:strand:+ start:2948 stop:3328 length:381 start_codon:yes stop_codon:yes gene_type:complete
MSAKHSNRRTQALALLEKLEPGAPERVAKNLDDFHCEAAEILLGFAFTDVVAREGIPLKVREMLTVAMLAAMGTGPGQLEFHMRAALNTGASHDEIVEIVLQVAVYAGIPAAMNAITAAKSAFMAR